MGMFDYLRCKYPLPVDGANNIEYQTKDTDAQFLDNYEISVDGQLFHEEYDIVDRSDPNAEKGSIESVLGCMSRENKRLVKENYTGEIRFYGGYPKRWVEFSAYFVGGQLKDLNLIENKLTPELERKHGHQAVSK